MKKFWEIIFTALFYAVFTMGGVILVFFILSFLLGWPDLPSGKTLLVYLIDFSFWWIYFSKNPDKRFRRV